MKAFKTFFSIFLTMGLLFTWSLSNAGGQDYSGNEDPNKKILKQGLLGAGVGAISSSASGGNAGQGALIGAGTNVIGGALLDTITSSPAPQSRPQPVQYVQSAPSYSQTSYPVQPQQQQQMVYQEPPQPVYYQQAPPQEDPTKKILKQGLLGAGVGAISSSASGGDAGKGALIGAGTNVIGGALLDALTGGSPQPQPVYYQQAPPQQQYSQSNQSYSGSQPRKKIVRKYDSDGKVISEEEVWE